ncbi:MAG TPA: MipA/OmpV family protein [Allosphingosinicella sp.]|jgi:outer membrane scaffolding protein for murein synthesis (MipA/OmpV family)|nr:MipA/OmpV family protein [Allosphingosinicella sp.]
MTVKTCLRAAALAAPLLAAGPALAQDSEEGRPYDRNSLTIGLGGAYVPSYDGSDDYILTPVGLAFGKVAGFGFATRGTALYVDLIPDKRDSAVDFDFGPLANVRLDRSNRIKDAQVRALGELDAAIELGAWAGLRKNGVLHQYDSIGARVAWQKDVSDTHGSTIVTPAIEYSSPLGTKTLASFSLQAEHVGDGYARTYYSIGAAGAAASGLAAYNADGGWKSWRATLLLGQSLTGDLRHPRLSLFGGVGYSRLLGDIARSPIVQVAGDRDQYFATLGLAYSF